jgi:hypothetical protein
MIKYKEPNPLAVFNMRRMTFCPIHFETITFDLRVGEKTISDWIYENTESRFFLGSIVRAAPLPPDGPGRVEPHQRKSANITREMVHCVGFENHSEASYFALFLNQVNTTPEFLS